MFSATSLNKKLFLLVRLLYMMGRGTSILFARRRREGLGGRGQWPGHQWLVRSTGQFLECRRSALTAAAKSVVWLSPVAYIRAKASFGRSRALVGNESWRERLSLFDEPEAMPLPTPMDPWFWGAGTARQGQFSDGPRSRAVFISGSGQSGPATPAQKPTFVHVFFAERPLGG